MTDGYNVSILSDHVQSYEYILITGFGQPAIYNRGSR
jgi:hypothetical protein